MSAYDLQSFSGPEPLAQAVASAWLGQAPKIVPPQCVAFSGGRIARNLFIAITSLARQRELSLRQIDFFWADERCVPPENPESNYLLAWENFLQPLALLEDKVHRLKGELPPSTALAEANATISRLAPANAAGTPVLDLIFLGLGENGHTASLMPNVPDAVADSAAPYIHIDNSPKPPPNRLSLSYVAIAAAKEVWMLASGKGKEDALRESLKPDGQTPFARVLRSRAHTRIFSDIQI
jgi:6-phosphogluconolactonase